MNDVSLDLKLFYVYCTEHVNDSDFYRQALSGGRV